MAPRPHGGLTKPMNEYRITVETLTPEDGGGYLAWVPDLPGCMSDGETPEEAMRNCREAIGEWIGHAIRQGKQIPAPTSGKAYA